MIHLTPSFLIAAATAFVGLGFDVEQHGPIVERWMKGVRAKTERWDAAFVRHVGFWSHYDHRSERSSWPIPALNSAHALAEFAEEKRVLERVPLVGDLFLLWSAAKRHFVHTGIVLDIAGRGEFPNGQKWVECTVLSPNVHANGTPGGGTIARLQRRFCAEAGDAFIRWVGLADNQEHKPKNETPAATNTSNKVGLKEAA